MAIGVVVPLDDIFVGVVIVPCVVVVVAGNAFINCLVT